MMRIKTGDLEPALTITLSAEDDTIDVTAATSIRVIGRLDGDLEPIIDREVDAYAVDGDTSVLTVRWQIGETVRPGYLVVDIVVTWPGGRPQRFDGDMVHIVPAVDYIPV